MSICTNGISRIRVKAANGKDSILFKNILDHYEGNRDDAIRLYAYANSQEFFDNYGNYKSNPESFSNLDINSEPKITDVLNTVSETDYRLAPKIGKDFSFAFDKDKFTQNTELDDETIKNNRKRSRRIIVKKRAILDDLYKHLTPLKFVDSNDARREEYKINMRISALNGEINRIEEEMDADALVKMANADLKRVSYILSNRNINMSDFFYAKNTLNVWYDVINTFFQESKTSDNTFYGEAKDDSLRFKSLSDVEAEAKRLINAANAKEVFLINQYLKSETGRDVDIKKVFREQQDYSAVHASTMSIDRTDNILFQQVANTNYKIIGRVKEQYQTFEKEIDVLIDKAERELKNIATSSDKYDIFREKYKDGSATGNMIRQFNPEYDDENAIQFSKAIESNSETSFATYYKWFNDNNYILDFRILFQGERDNDGLLFWNETQHTKAEKDKLINDLKELVGEKETQRLLELSEKYLDDYASAREVAIEEINSRADRTTDQKDEDFRRWEVTYSPFYYSNAIVNQKIYTIGNSIANHKGRHSVMAVPRKTNRETGQDTGWFNEDFAKIKNSPAVYEFYLKFIKTNHMLNHLLPYTVSNHLRDNTIPTLRKTMYDHMTEDGMKGVMKDVYQGVINSLTTNDSNELVYADIDPYTGEIEKNLTISFVKQNLKEINKRYTTRLIQFESTNNAKASIEDKRKIKKEVMDSMAREKSFDLGKILKAYYMSVMFYTAKARIEDLVRVSDSVFQREAEVLRTASGKNKRQGRIGELLRKSPDRSFKNIKDQWDYWVEYFYGHRSDDEHVFATKVLTKEEKEEKTKILELMATIKKDFENGDIEAEEYNLKLTKLETILEELGRNYSSAKIGRTILKYNQLKSMGWNAFSGVTNMTQGYINNFMEANDGRLFTKKNLGVAYKKVFNSVLKNYSFNTIESNEAKKIRSLMDRMDAMSETSNELYQRSFKNRKTGGINWMNPYNIQNRSEYFNQAPLLVATMLSKNNMVKDLKGNDVPIYEAFDEEGKWKTDIFGAEDPNLIDNLKLKIAATISKVHGNYNSEMPIRANKKVITSAMKQFRTWMFEGVADRFQREQFSDALKIQLKGRYRSGVMGFVRASAKSKTNEQGERIDEKGNIIKDYERGIDLKEILDNQVFSIKQLLRKLVFMDTQYDERFSEVDAANLRKNLSELVILGQVSGLILLLSMLGGDDDDDKLKFYVKNYTLNALFRGQADITLYLSPDSLEQVSQRPIPVMSLITDMHKLINASISLALGNDEITRGLYTGESKFKRALFRNLPLVSKVQSNKSAAIQVYNNIQGAK